MVRIKITDLPRDKKITKQEMKKVMGGFNPQPEPPGRLSRGSIYNPSLLNPRINPGLLTWDY